MIPTIPARQQATDLTSVVTINVTQGTIYRIAINGFNNGGSLGDIGSYRLSWFRAHAMNRRDFSSLRATIPMPSRPLTQ